MCDAGGRKLRCWHFILSSLVASCEAIKKVSCSPLTLQENLQCDFCFNRPVLSAAITHSVAFSSCLLVVNMELILCVVRRGYKRSQGFCSFWNWSGEKANTRNLASFTQPVDLVELTLLGRWHGVFPGQ